MSEPLIKVKNLNVKYKTEYGFYPAVDNTSFAINEQEIFALVGESGCGKSTTAHALMRLFINDNTQVGGEVLFNGNNILSLSKKEMTKIRGKEIGMIFQNPLDSLNPVYTAGAQVYEAIALDNIPKDEAWERVLNLFEEVKLSDPEHRIKTYPHELSGGMRQRVMIGMMLGRRPQLLIADEPTTALDVTIQAQILDIIKNLKKEFKTSVLLITHDFGIVAEVADRVGVMYAGKIVEIGNVFKIFDNPRHPYTRLLMESLPRITKKEGRLAMIPGSVPELSEPISGCKFHNRCPQCQPSCTREEPALLEVEIGHFAACPVVNKNAAIS